LIHLAKKTEHSRIVYEDIQLSSTSICNVGFCVLDRFVFGYVEFDEFKTDEALEPRHRLKFSRTGYDLVSFARYIWEDNVESTTMDIPRRWNSLASSKPIPPSEQPVMRTVSVVGILGALFGYGREQVTTRETSSPNLEGRVLIGFGIRRAGQATSDLMFFLLSVFLRILKTVVLSYAVVATVYTLLVPLVAFLPTHSSLRVGVDLLSSPSSKFSEIKSDTSLHSNVGPGKLRWAEEPVYWRPSPSFFFKTSPRRPLSMTEELFMNKAFSQSLQPTNIVPFYYRSSKSSEKQLSYEDISIATLVTRNRFVVLAKLARKYQGTHFSLSNVALTL